MVLNGSKLAEYIGEEINEQRRERGYGSLSTDGLTPNILTDMAENHSRRMPEAGYATHYYGKNNSADRYKVHDLYTRCQFASDEGGYLVTADRDQLEVVGKIDASRQVNRHDDPVAIYETISEALVERWFESSVSSEKLSYENSQMLGAGAVFTSEDQVYATVTLC